MPATLTRLLVLCGVALAAACSQRPPASDAAPSRTYRCDTLGEIVARYDHDTSGRPRVTLTIGGERRELLQIVAASGARYATENGLHPDHNLIWSTKGPDATLLEIPLDDMATPADARTLASCRERPGG